MRPAGRRRGRVRSQPLWRGELRPRRLRGKPKPRGAACQRKAARAARARGKSRCEGAGPQRALVPVSGGVRAVGRATAPTCGGLFAQPSASRRRGTRRVGTGAVGPEPRSQVGQPPGERSLARAGGVWHLCLRNLLVSEGAGGPLLLRPPQEVRAAPSPRCARSAISGAAAASALRGLPDAARPAGRWPRARGERRLALVEALLAGLGGEIGLGVNPDFGLKISQEAI